MTVDDQEMFRGVARDVIDATPGFESIGEATSGEEALEAVERLAPELVRIQERKLRVRDTMAIERGRDTVATVKKALITPLRERFKLEMAGGGEYEIKGNLVDHEYTFQRDGREVVRVSKRWFRVRDTYGVEISPGEDEVLMLAASVAIDQMARA